MNIISTHDTIRAITSLSGADFPCTKKERAHFTLSNKDYETAKKRLMCAVVLQTFLPGIPTIYYGDEIGMEGLEDPFNRMPMKWDKVDFEILSWYRLILKIRKENRPAYEGGLKVENYNESFLWFSRTHDGKTIDVFVNASSENQFNIDYNGKDLISGGDVSCVKLPPNTSKIFLRLL